MSVLDIKYISDVTFGPMLAHKAEEGIVAVEYIHSGHGDVNYWSVVYMHPEVAMQHKVARFLFLADSHAKTNLDTEGQVKFLVGVETDSDRILGVHMIEVKRCAKRKAKFERTFETQVLPQVIFMRDDDSSYPPT
ncbi:hypothetical protein EDB87DRAFT_1580923 [Lactarius vividus]|nr:hypothetical protein EDB87DRAFT_1580923 [Lactarius vividus]